MEEFNIDIAHVLQNRDFSIIQKLKSYYSNIQTKIAAKVEDATTHKIGMYTYIYTYICVYYVYIRCIPNKPIYIINILHILIDSFYLIENKNTKNI